MAILTKLSELERKRALARKAASAATPWRLSRESKACRMAELNLLEKECSAASGARTRSSAQCNSASAPLVSEEEGTQETAMDAREQEREQPAEEVADPGLSRHLGRQIGVEVAGLVPDSVLLSYLQLAW